jgi:deoxyribodipyrimidine photo-lyase
MNIVWLRTDLRLEDNPALYHASEQGPTCCVYVITPAQWQAHDDAPAKIAFWRARLITLKCELSLHNIPLKLLIAETYQDIPDALATLAQQLGATSLFFNHEYPLNEKNRDARVCETFLQLGLKVQGFHGDLVIPPGLVTTQQDSMYKVFTPFSRQWHKQLSDSQLQLFPAPQKQASMPCTSDDVEHYTASQWGIKEVNYRTDLWPTDTHAIHQRLEKFCANAAKHYKEQRDIPSVNGTSTLSPYLASGMISVRQCIFSIRQHIEEWRSNQWVTELIWREFYRHLLDNYPHLSRSENFINMPNPILWERDEALFQAWCDGETGFPIVDAAMKQLVQTGWMHNRLRMVTAAFLSKLLLIDWRKGEAFFMQHLLDGDYASNNGGWQWAASTGADAAPYFRIFSPERQSQRFDTEGTFIQRLLPELTGLDKKSIHTPSSQQRLDCGYIEPIVDYKYARQRALERYAIAMGKQ